MYGAFNWEGERKGRERWTNKQLSHTNLRAAEALCIILSMEILVTCENPKQD